MTRWLGTNRAIRTGWLALALLLPLAAPAGLLKMQPHPKRNDHAKSQVEQMEQDWRTAELQDDVPAMDRMLADDYVGITMNGQVVTKMQQLDRVRNRQLELQKLDLDDVKVKLIGRTAIVTSLADVEGTIDGVPVHGKFRYTRVYTRDPGGDWKITNFEATQVGMPHPRPMNRNAPAPREPEPPGGGAGSPPR